MFKVAARHWIVSCYSTPSLSCMPVSASSLHTNQLDLPHNLPANFCASPGQAHHSDWTLMFNIFFFSSIFALFSNSCVFSPPPPLPPPSIFLQLFQSSAVLSAFFTQHTRMPFRAQGGFRLLNITCPLSQNKKVCKHQPYAKWCILNAQPGRDTRHIQE